MKKSFSFFSRFAVIFFSVLFMFSLFSCSGLLQKESDSNGSVSFELPVEDILTQINSSRSIDSSRIAYCSYRMDISIIGNKYEVTKSTTITEADKKLSIRFDKIPVGKKVYAVAKIYEVVEKNGTKNENLVMYGKSETKKIKAGLTFLKLNIYNYLNDFQFTLTISFSDISSDELENVVNNLIISAVPANSNEGRAITEAGSDKYKLYETLSTPFSDSSQFYCNGHDEKLTISLDKSNKKLTVSGTMAIPVNEDAPGAKGKEIMLVASMYKNQNDSLKPKLFGKSQNIIPEKGKQFDAAITVKKLNVMDTPVVTWSATLDSPSRTMYYLDEKSFTSSKTNYFCFDNNGNFYCLSVNGSDSNIFASNKTNSLTINSASYSGIICDIATNKFYLYGFMQASLNLLDITEVINTWSTESINTNLKMINLKDGDENILSSPYYSENYSKVVVNNDVLYAITCNDYGSGKKCLISVPVSASGLVEPSMVVDLFAETPFESLSVSFDSWLKITDMLYIDGAVYILVRDYTQLTEDTYDNEKYYNLNIDSQQECVINSRGAIIKYDISTSNIKVLGETNTPLDISNQRFYSYGKPFSYSNFCIAEDYKPQNFVAVDRTYYSASLNFPECYVPSSPNQFYGPQKIVAIKPKKLVIADDGIAFYSDGYGFSYKNVNRIVTIDLEKFAYESETKATVTFADEAHYPIFSSIGIMTGKLTDTYYYREKDDNGDFIWKTMPGISATQYFGIPLAED